MKILISIDTGDSAEIVLTEAKNYLANFPEADIHVLTVMDMALIASERDFESTIAMDTMEKQAHQLLGLATGILGDNGFILTSEMGDPVNEILEKAEELQCDLLIMGTHGRSGLDHMLIGSIAEKVLRQVNCNTLIIPTKKKTAKG